MPSPEDVAKRVAANNAAIEQAKVAKAENAALRKAALGKIEGGTQGDPETDNEAGESEHDMSGPTAGEDESSPNAPEVLTAAAVKTLQGWTNEEILGLIQETKNDNLQQMAVDEATQRGLILTEAEQKAQAFYLAREWEEGTKGFARKKPGCTCPRFGSCDCASSSKVPKFGHSAKQLQEGAKFVQPKEDRPKGLTNDEIRKRVLKRRQKHKFERKQLQSERKNVALKAGLAGAGAMGLLGTLPERRRRKDAEFDRDMDREALRRVLNNATHGKELEEDEKRLGGAARKLGKMFADEARRTPGSTVAGVAGLGGTTSILLEQRRQKQKQKTILEKLGLKELAHPGQQRDIDRKFRAAGSQSTTARRYVDPTIRQNPGRPDEETTQRAGKQSVRPSDLVFGQKNPLDDPDYNGIPGIQEPDEIRQQLDLTPMEEQLFEQLVADGSAETGVESVDAGQAPEPAMPGAPTGASPVQTPADPAPPEPEPAPEQRAIPDPTVQQFGPAENQPPGPAVPGQEPTETNPAAQHPDAAPEPRPEGATYQGAPEGAETSEAVPMAPPIPDAIRSTVTSPPLTPQEAQETGQSEEEAFRSLIEKMTRLQESMGTKELETGEKTIGRLIANAGVRFGQFLGRAAPRAGQGIDNVVGSATGATSRFGRAIADNATSAQAAFKPGGLPHQAAGGAAALGRGIEAKPGVALGAGVGGGLAGRHIINQARENRAYRQQGF